MDSRRAPFVLVVVLLGLGAAWYFLCDHDSLGPAGGATGGGGDVPMAMGARDLDRLRNPVDTVPAAAEEIDPSADHSGDPFPRVAAPLAIFNPPEVLAGHGGVNAAFSASGLWRAKAGRKRSFGPDASEIISVLSLPIPGCDLLTRSVFGPRDFLTTNGH